MVDHQRSPRSPVIRFKYAILLVSAAISPGVCCRGPCGFHTGDDAPVGDGGVVTGGGTVRLAATRRRNLAIKERFTLMTPSAVNIHAAAKPRTRRRV